MKSTSITPSEFWTLHMVDPTATLIDVSEPADFERFHASCSAHVPPDEVVKIAAQAKVCGKPLYLISCRGATAAALGQELDRRGYSNIVSITGGTEAWAGSDLPIWHGHAFREDVLIAMSGFVVVAGLVAGILVPNLLMLPLFGLAAGIAVVLIIWSDSMGYRRIRRKF
jgi:rhodanese-related sulfurtransferase